MTPADFNPYAAPAEDEERDDDEERSRPEAYVLATPGQRFAGNSIDTLALMIPLVFAYFQIVTLDPEEMVKEGGLFDTDAWTMFKVGLAAALVIGLVQCVMISSTGQSIGKRMVKTKIVRLDGSNPGFLHGVFLRSFVGNLAGAIPFVGWIYSLVDGLFVFRRDRRTIRDHIARTRVIRI